jgi:hypothetical protein
MGYVPLLWGIRTSNGRGHLVFSLRVGELWKTVDMESVRWNLLNTCSRPTCSSMSVYAKCGTPTLSAARGCGQTSFASDTWTLNHLRNLLLQSKIKFSTLLVWCLTVATIDKGVSTFHYRFGCYYVIRKWILRYKRSSHSTPCGHHNHPPSSSVGSHILIPGTLKCSK